MASLRHILLPLAFFAALVPSQAERLVDVAHHFSSSSTTYKCGGLLSATDACYPATYNIAVKKWLPCEVQCKAGMICSCPGSGSCSSVETKNPGLRFIENAFYSVKVNTETKEWEMLTSEDVGEGEAKVKKYSWVFPGNSKHEIKGVPFMEPSNVFTPNVDGDYCDPDVAGKYQEDLEKKMAEW
mmetsp:Transcript_50770/g.140839  ORF Transcript_50770/g.140839 Transcript_50770/m.140839 type:complete len:184 (-) Transcript_50770:107-658(-)|eukprot:CAMPEP_0179041944 /NCGR_PEP_ID=MMETSP0796-20121207/16413_1 /TAXON_ID=73915 /ORGANISM="Pyrodinium bahamense, Strain pbaha01" /LENGTH=183 /DNA_ID=CAMNT_0020738315 /DNA_START=162 /DNA_END=710 /DNA_ORIENTATION=+